jgi:predicted nucleic acid-binding protein
LRVVVDTNILVSALLSGASLPAHLIFLWRDGVFDLLTSDAQLDELMRVTRYREYASGCRQASRDDLSTSFANSQF